MSTAPESVINGPIAAPFVRVAAGRALGMVGFLTIFAAAVSGYAGLGIWAILLTALALLSLSQASYGALYKRAESMGLSTAAKPFFLISALNAIVTTAIAYVAGLGLNYI